MRLFAYVVTHDSGFAPNPFGGYCTLATCKPKIRLRAKVDDWIVGVGCVKTAGHDHLVYAMKVAEVLPFGRYAADRRFRSKKPVVGSDTIFSAGDNLYEPNGDGWRRLPSPHHADDAAMFHDLNGRYVLVATQFYYFGRNAPKIPARVAELVPRGRGDRCRFPESLTMRFVEWLTRVYGPGIHGEPWHLNPTPSGDMLVNLRPRLRPRCLPTRSSVSAP